MEPSKLIGFVHSSAIVLSNVCRRSCGYCQFRSSQGTLLSLKSLNERLFEIRSGKAVEVVLLSGDCPQEYPQIQMALHREECASWEDYLERACRLTLQLDLLPVLALGSFETVDLKRLSELACSIRIDAVTDDLSEVGQAHENARGRNPAAVRTLIEKAHAACVPYHLGILVGIGESQETRLNFFREIGRFCAVDPYLQDLRIVPFQALPGTAMRDRPPVGFDDMQELVRTAKEAFPVHQISVPVNLFSRFPELFPSGVNDLGSLFIQGEDPSVPSFPVPDFAALEKKLLEGGFYLQERLPLTTVGAFRRAGVKTALEAARYRIKTRLQSQLDLQDNHHCFVCGTENKTGMKLKIQMCGVYACNATWIGTPEFQGYAGMVHGGVLSTLLDELMAQSLIRSGVRVVTADMRIRFLRPAPLGMPMTIFGGRVNGRSNVHFAKGNITLSDGTIVAEAEGRYAEC